MSEWWTELETASRKSVRTILKTNSLLIRDRYKTSINNTPLLPAVAKRSPKGALPWSGLITQLSLLSAAKRFYLLHLYLLTLLTTYPPYWLTNTDNIHIKHQRIQLALFAGHCCLTIYTIKILELQITATTVMTEWHKGSHDTKAQSVTIVFRNSFWVSTRWVNVKLDVSHENYIYKFWNYFNINWINTKFWNLLETLKNFWKSR